MPTKDSDPIDVKLRKPVALVMSMLMLTACVPLVSQLGVIPCPEGGKVSVFNRPNLNNGDTQNVGGVYIKMTNGSLSVVNPDLTSKIRYSKGNNSSLAFDIATQSLDTVNPWRSATFTTTLIQNETGYDLNIQAICNK